jgi:uncharacterized membrane-anchored protein
MNVLKRNFWLDLGLYVLVGLNLATTLTSGSHAADAVHLITGILLTVGIGTHMYFHRAWFSGIFTPKNTGRMRIRCLMISMVATFFILAGITGSLSAHIPSGQLSSFHMWVGWMALLGLCVHAIKHVRWMPSAANKCLPSVSFVCPLNKNISIPRWHIK